jgi:leucyl aminopeptidase
LPIDIHVTLLTADDPASAGAYLSAVARGAVAAPDLIAVPVAPGDLGASWHDVDPFLPGGSAVALAAAELTGRAGESAEAPAQLGTGQAGTGDTRILFVGTGDGSLSALRRAGAVLGRRAAHGKTVGTAATAGWPDEAVQAFAEGILLGSYTFTLKSGNPDTVIPGEVRLLTGPAGGASTPAPGTSAAVGRARTVATAVALTRDLANTPSTRKSPGWLADRAVDVAARAGLGSRVWTEAELLAAGFGGILAVGSGSVRPPRLIELSYTPDGWDRHIVLVGKGITFDSGGLSLKPNEGMKLMKTDMAGGAAVIAVLSALAELGVRAKVTGLIAAAENMPSGSAYRPGDVITQYGGRTVEILNTDAEGRLVLADALAYADAELNPDVMVDIATLTGAARIALGSAFGALYATDGGVAAALLAAGQASGERIWQMPLPDDYRDALDSPVADLAHVARDGAAGSSAGSIAAALFLQEFSGGRAWAHLDVSGPSRAGSDDGEITKGATGFGTRLLLNWLSSS